jgi:type IV secretory pathway TrbL component
MKEKEMRKVLFYLPGLLLLTLLCWGGLFFMAVKFQTPWLISWWMLAALPIIMGFVALSEAE